jgi:hypothetical protein
VLDLAGGFTPDAFRLAWLVQYPVWAVGVVCLLLARRTARRARARQDDDPDGSDVPSATAVSGAVSPSGSR